MNNLIQTLKDVIGPELQSSATPETGEKIFYLPYSYIMMIHEQLVHQGVDLPPLRDAEDRLILTFSKLGTIVLAAATVH